MNAEQAQQDGLLRQMRAAVSAELASWQEAARIASRDPEIGPTPDYWQHHLAVWQATLAALDELREYRTGRGKQCRQCGGHFLPSRRGRLYCSTKCRDAWYYARRPKRPRGDQPVSRAVRPHPGGREERP